jgi:hypothetical protein
LERCFEHARDGLPANWLVDSPATVPSGRFALALDREDRREGAQALRFDVAECSGEPGWRSPGISQELRVEPGRAYAVSFWVKSEGCEWVARAGGVDAKLGAYETIDAALPAGEWTRVERVVAVPERYERLRFELGVRSPGRLWVDDVRVEPVAR